MLITLVIFTYARDPYFSSYYKHIKYKTFSLWNSRCIWCKMSREQYTVAALIHIVVCDDMCTVPPWSNTCYIQSRSSGHAAAFSRNAKKREPQQFVKYVHTSIRDLTVVSVYQNDERPDVNMYILLISIEIIRNMLVYREYYTHYSSIHHTTVYALS